MHILREHDVLSLLSHLSVSECHHLLSKLHAVLREFSRSKSLDLSAKTVHQPERQVIVTNTGNTTLFMPSSITVATGIKVVTISPAGLKGSINVFAPNGTLRGVINAEEVTALRTALAVMLMFVRFPRPKENVVVFGAGRQAEWHVKLTCLLAGEEVRRVTVVNRRGPRRMDSLFTNLRQQHPRLRFEVISKEGNEDYDEELRQRLEDANVVMCCTPATTPHFPYQYLQTKREARFVSLIGSYKPEMHEVDTQTLLSGAGNRMIYVDTKEGCMVEAGELIRAKVTKDQLVEIGELQDDAVADLGDGKNLVFKCVGLGMMDVVMADELLRMAEEKNVGLVVDDF